MAAMTEAAKAAQPFIEEAISDRAGLIGWRIRTGADTVLVFMDQSTLHGFRAGDAFVPSIGESISYVRAALTQEAAPVSQATPPERCAKCGGSLPATGRQDRTGECVCATATSQPPAAEALTKEWCVNMAKLEIEHGAEFEAGAAKKRCPYCDDTGDVTRSDGEWLGVCSCPAGVALSDQAAMRASQTDLDTAKARMEDAPSQALDAMADNARELGLSWENPAPNASVPLVRAILENASAFEWSLQGMGMLRLHLSDNYRLHIWDSRYRAPNVSMIHDHLQWGLTSTVIAGRLVNRRYAAVAERGQDYVFGTLKPGVGCYFKTGPEPIRLRPLAPDTYEAGQSYTQAPAEIHESDPEDGTVTLMRKTPTADESARVFWPAGGNWVSAEPRRATPEEVASITQFALERWFGATPPQAQPVADGLAVAQQVLATTKPLSPDKLRDGREEIFSTGNPFCPCDSKTFEKVARWTERAHGIGLSAKAKGSESRLNTAPPALTPPRLTMTDEQINAALDAPVADGESVRFYLQCALPLQDHFGETEQRLLSEEIIRCAILAAANTTEATSSDAGKGA